MQSLKEIANFPEAENWIHHQMSGYYGRMALKPGQKPTICHNCGQEGHKSTYCQEEKIDRAEL